jgi:hypothetical protein
MFGNNKPKVDCQNGFAVCQSLSKCLKFCDVTLYADDTVLSFASSSTDEIQRKMNSEISLNGNP